MCKWRVRRGKDKHKTVLHRVIAGENHRACTARTLATHKLSASQADCVFGSEWEKNIEVG